MEIENKKEKDYLLPTSFLISAIIISGSWFYNKQLTDPKTLSDQEYTKLEEMVLPSGGFTLPVKWGDLGVQMVKTGVIDKEKVLEVYNKKTSFSITPLYI